jgi:transcriptional regulator with XRE-family HTH domain
MARLYVVVDPAFPQVLRALRKERGLSLRALADATKLSHAYIWDLEKGTKQLAADTAAILDLALQANGRLSALVSAVSADTQQIGIQASTSDLDRDTARNVEELRSDLMESISAGTMGPASLDDWELTVNRLGRATRYRPAPELLTELVDEFRELPLLLRQIHTSTSLRRMTRVTAQMAGLVFLTFIKMGNRSAARSWARTARIAAQEAQDPALQSWVLAQEAYVHYYADDLREALSVARQAQNLTRGIPCVGAALAAALEARAFGVLGEEADALAAMDRAEAALDGLSPDEVSPSAFGYNEAQLRFHQGNALTHLHDTDYAWSAQKRALDLYPPSDYMDRALVHLDRASCLAHDGESETAMLYATQTLLSLTGEQRTGLIAGRGQEVYDALPDDQRTLPAARDFRDVLMLPTSEGENA